MNHIRDSCLEEAVMLVFETHATNLTFVNVK